MTPPGILPMLAHMARGYLRQFGLASVLGLIAAGVSCSTDITTLRLVPPALLDAPRWINIDRGLEYARPDGQPLQYDSFRPAWITSPLPLVILVHGGSWRSGSRVDM